jgi:hypothetical protein
LPFLIVGTAAAAFAAYMNKAHFPGWLGLAACGVSSIGYIGHIFSHLFDEIENRERLKAWLKAKEEIEAQIKALQAAEQARYARQVENEAAREEAEIARITAQTTAVARSRAAEAVPAPSASGADPEARSATSNRKPSGKGRGKIGKDDAVQLGLERGVDTPAPLKAAILEAGWELPKSTSTIENWCRLIKQSTVDAQ